MWKFSGLCREQESLYYISGHESWERQTPEFVLMCINSLGRLIPIRLREGMEVLGS